MSRYEIFETVVGFDEETEYQYLVNIPTDKEGDEDVAIDLAIGKHRELLLPGSEDDQLELRCWAARIEFDSEEEYEEYLTDRMSDSNWVKVNIDR